MRERVVVGNPKEVAEYTGLVDKKFHDWHQNEWAIPYPDYRYFRETIANGSFLAYLEYILKATGTDGAVDLDALESQLKETLGIYFSEHKFENAIAVVKEREWESL